MSALDWVRNKAAQTEIDTMEIPAESAGEGTKAGTWRVTRWHYKGTLPIKMAAQIRNELTNVVNVQSGDIQTHEVLRIGGQYRSDYGRCEFSKTVYEFME
jgi:hypothetical protein